MISINVSTFKKTFDEVLDRVSLNQEVVVVKRENEENIVMINENYYDELQKEISNLQYLLKLAKADRQVYREKIKRVCTDVL